MRTSVVVVVLSLCSPALSRPSKPSLDSQIDGRAFAARSALITEANGPGQLGWTDDTGRHEAEVVTSTLYVFEREVTCSDFKRVEHGRYVVMLGTGERAIELKLQGTWPFAKDATLSTDVKDPSRDRATASFRVGPNGSIGSGTVTIADATRTTGLLDVDLDTTKWKGTDRARGTLRVTVCR